MDEQLENFLHSREMGEWSHWFDEYSLNDDKFPAFLETYASGKRLTIELLNTAWQTYKQQRERKEIAATFGEPTDPRKVSARPR